MAIDAYTGLPGHGKSYGVVEHVVIPSLKQDRLVVTNIPLEVDALLADFGGNIQLLPHDWFERPDMADLAPPGCVLILDELWRRWPAGMKANQASIQDKSLLAEHRHRVDSKGRSMRIVLVTQGLDQVASWARTLIETTYRMHKFNQKAFRVDIYRGVVTGPKPPKSQLLRQTAGTFKPRIQAYYKSATLSQTGGVGDESKADGRASLFRSYGLWGLVAIMVVCGVFGVMGVASFFSPDRYAHKSPAPVAAPARVESQPIVSQTTTSRAAAQVYGTRPEGPVMSASWRVAGYVRRGTGGPDRAWSSVEGYNHEPRQHISQTARVVLVSVSGASRFLPIDKCQFFERSPDIYCDVDGERVTPWTGRGAVTSVIDPIASVQPVGMTGQTR